MGAFLDRQRRETGSICADDIANEQIGAAWDLKVDRVPPGFSDQ